jgi:hypothetical protein
VRGWKGGSSLSWTTAQQRPRQEGGPSASHRRQQQQQLLVCPITRPNIQLVRCYPYYCYTPCAHPRHQLPHAHLSAMKLAGT